MKREDILQQAIQDILAELTRAEHLHPVWPCVGHRGDHVWACGIVGEEAGEALQAALNWMGHGRGSVGHIHKELVQTGAMVLRALVNLEAVERQRVNESARQDLQEEHNVYPGERTLNYHVWESEEPGRYSLKDGVTVYDYSKEMAE